MDVWVDGKYLPLDSPALSARDQGFLHGEAVYEGVKLIGRRPLFLEAHLERLEESARAIGIGMPWNAAVLRPILTRLLDGAGRPAGSPDLDPLMARLYLTRGPSDGSPSALVWLEPLPDRSLRDTPPWRLARHPTRIVPYLPAVKHTSRLAHARARRDARASGADDALLVHATGWVLEGPASNVFFFESDTLHTPELGCGILAGITRDIVLDLAPSCGFKTVEGRYPAEILAAADECFLTFTSAGIMPVAALDGEPFPDPVPGERTRRLREAYEGHAAKALAAVEPL